MCDSSSMSELESDASSQDGIGTANQSRSRLPSSGHRQHGTNPSSSILPPSITPTKLSPRGNSQYSASAYLASSANTGDFPMQSPLPSPMPSPAPSPSPATNHQASAALSTDPELLQLKYTASVEYFKGSFKFCVIL